MGRNLKAFNIGREKILDFLQQEGVKTTEQIRAHLIAEPGTIYGWLQRMKTAGEVQSTSKKRSSTGWEPIRWRATPPDSIR